MSDKPINATDSTELVTYGIRKCRDSHWHVTIGGLDDLATKPDALTYERALEIATRLNAGEELDDIESPRVGLSRGAEPANLLSPRGEAETHRESRTEIKQRVIMGGGTMDEAFEEIKRVESASGDDEELKGRIPEELIQAIDAFEEAAIERSIARNAVHRGEQWVWVSDANPLMPPKRRRTQTFVIEADNDARDTWKALESLFGRIKEERDRLEAECLMELLHEPTGKMLPVRVRTVVQALESELGRIREELKEAQTTIETRRKFEQDAATDLSEAWEEIRRLRSSSLTPEEAQFIVQRVSSLGVSHPHFQMVTPTIYEKLRSIAGPPDKKEQ